MKLSEIVTRVQRQFGDDVQAQITKEDIVRWVNDACLEIVSTNHTNEGMHKGITPVTAHQYEYNLPADLLLLRAVRLNGKSLQHSTYEQLMTQSILPSATEDYPVGEPDYYWVLGSKLYVTPTPEVSLGTVDILYVKTPDILTTLMMDVEPDVPKQYHLRIVEYCIAQAAELDDNIAQYQVKLQEFKGNLTNLRQNGEQPESDGVYPSITYVEW